VSRISVAKIGSSAVAPPKSTASRSRVIAPRIVRSRQMWPTPANMPPAEWSGGGASAARGCSDEAMAANTRHAKPAAANTAHACPVNFSRAPARIGPPIAVVWKIALFQVMAFWKRSGGTSDGSRLCRVGMLKARTQPLSASAA
jgi:hypothetical protein